MFVIFGLLSFTYYHLKNITDCDTISPNNNIYIYSINSFRFQVFLYFGQNYKYGSNNELELRFVNSLLRLKGRDEQTSFWNKFI